MEIDIPERKHPNIHKYSQHDFLIAKKFAEAIQKELGKFLKAVVLFGSSARKTASEGSDIDVLILIDDTSIIMTRDVSEGYRIVIQQTIAKISRKLHIVTLKLTSFWDYIRNGDPIGINMLRDGVSLIDTGFFEPAQLLLKKGKIRPTKENIWAYYIKAPTTLNNAKWHITQAVVDLYWAVIDSAHAALMSQGAVPPTPEHVSDLLDEVLVKPGLIGKEYSKIMRFFYDKAKAIMHHEIDEISGDDFDKYLLDANKFVDRMKMLIELNK
jgi:uncharacterized protein (UPF0332 family)